MGIPLRVLHIEDSENDQKLLAHYLESAGYDLTIHRVETREEMVSVLAEDEFDVIISDHRLPIFSGPDALQVMQEIGLDLPFIVVSGTVGEAAAVDTMKAGAHDYVMKDNLARLVPAIEREMQDAQERRERRRAAAALHESEHRFRTMADSAPMLLWMTDADGHYAYVNKPWLDFTRRTLAQETGAGHRDRIHPSDLEIYNAAYNAAAAQHNPFQIEYRMQRHDGQWRWMLDTGTPRFHEDGSFAGYIGTCIDLTDRKVAEIEREQMRQQNERLLREAATVALQQKGFLRDILYSVTEGKLHLCNSIDELPPLPPKQAGPIGVSSINLREIRVVTSEIASRHGVEGERCIDLVTAVGEAAMNAVVHGGGGIADVYAEPGRVLVSIEDRGHGIDLSNLPRATLERGYTTEGSLGHGFFMILNFSDRLFLKTGADGTTVVIEQNRTSPEPAWLTTEHTVHTLADASALN